MIDSVCEKDYVYENDCASKKDGACEKDYAFVRDCACAKDCDYKIDLSAYARDLCSDLDPESSILVVLVLKIC